MKVSVSLGVILLPFVFSVLAKPKPFFQERRLIDRIVESSRSEGRRDSALRNLERLADGEIPRFDAAAREELGFSATTLSGMAYRMPVFQEPPPSGMLLNERYGTSIKIVDFEALEFLSTRWPSEGG
jgi:hypothetical protein